MARTRPKDNEPTIVKKYANRRLYDTGRSSYVTLEDLCEMVKEGHDFVVIDAKTNEDLTRSVLTQIIVEQESTGENLLGTGFLRNLISLYGNGSQGFVPTYLEGAMSVLTQNQEKLRDHMTKSLDDLAPFKGMMPSGPVSLEEINRRNMEIFEKTMKMFSSFSIGNKS